MTSHTAFKAGSAGLRQHLAAEQREVGSLKQSLADRNLAKRQPTQAEAAMLQQELQGLQSSTAEAEKQLQSEVSSLQGQLETALAECAKASQTQGQLETALKNSRNAHQQREAAFKARRAAEEREKRPASEFMQAEGALGQGEEDRQSLISQRAAALHQQGQHVEALEKQLQKLQGVEKASRQEVEKLSRQLYLKRPQVAPSGQQHAVAQIEQKHQRQLAALAQQLADAEERVKSQEEAVKAAEKRAEGSEAAHNKTKAELQEQTTYTQFRKDTEYMDDQSSKIDGYLHSVRNSSLCPSL
ncbi:TPA: hypothetical protein ACH3X1_000116 [Trebouxia sp. C0004]